ncbi:hypothetical protein R1sor_012271 [Riccia sorocarpa]|uniref:Protein DETOXIFICATION n=1 Tax=Riccia sorocarpa TaxID=122646 RepID=A0ABD3I738_9MARC
MESTGGEEQAPLLDYHYKDDGSKGFQDEPPTSTSEMIIEAKSQLELGVPVILMGLLDYSVQLISVAFVGSLGPIHLAGAAMGASFANVFGFAMLEGLAGGMETSGGQANGKGEHHLLGYLLQRGQFILTMFCLPIALLYLQAAWVLRHWGQDEEIAELSGEYVVYLIPGLFATALFLPVAKFLQVQEVTKPLAVVSSVVLAFHGPLCWLYIYGLDFGFVGAAMANSTSNMLTLILLVLFLKFERSGILERCWPGFSTAAFANVGAFLGLALPACAMTSLEWWVWEIIQIMAGWLPHPEIAVSAMTISVQTVALCYMPLLGLGTAASIRVSNALGAQRPDKTRIAVKVAFILAVVAGGLLAVALRLGRYEWATLFIGRSQTMVVNTYVGLVTVLMISIFFGGMNASLGGVVRGSGQQWAGSLVNNVALYGISLPLAYVLGIRMQTGLQGLWWAMLIGVIVQFVGLFYLTANTNWDYQVSRALLTVSDNSAGVTSRSAEY